MCIRDRTVTKRAEALLAALEAKQEKVQAAETDGREETAAPPAQIDAALGMGSLFGSTLREALCSLDIMTMTPLEALNELYRLQEQAKGEEGRA